MQTLQATPILFSRQSSSANTQEQTENEVTASSNKTITEKLNESMQKYASSKKSKQGNKVKEKYQPRFEYSGFVKNTRWVYLKDVNLGEQKAENEVNDEYIDKLKILGQSETDDTVAKESLKRSNLKKYCVVVAFSGANYVGMQWNRDIPTVERFLFKAMLKNNWVTAMNVQRPSSCEFQHGSRTDKGVSAAQMCISLRLRKYSMLLQISYTYFSFSET